MSEEKIELVFSADDIVFEASCCGKKITKKQATEFIGFMNNKSDMKGFYEMLQAYIDGYFGDEK